MKSDFNNKTGFADNHRGLRNSLELGQGWMFRFISYMRPFFQDWETWLVYLMHRNKNRGSNKMKKHRNKLQTNKTKQNLRIVILWVGGVGRYYICRRRIRMQFQQGEWKVTLKWAGNSGHSMTQEIQGGISTVVCDWHGEMVEEDQETSYLYWGC